MRQALTYIVVATALCTPGKAAERKSWNKIRYMGGTVQVQASRFDWNTTLTISLKPDTIVVTIAPAKLFDSQKTIRITPARLISLSFGETAWKRVGEVTGAQLPANQPSLFGLLRGGGPFGLVYETDDGKRGAILLESNFTWEIIHVLKTLTGKPIEDSP